MVITTILSSSKVKKLAEVALPLGLEGTTELPFTRRALRNCWNDQGKIIQRPGLTLRGTNSLVARGSFEWNGDLYVVASQELLKITDVLTGTYTSIGTIAGTADIRTANGFNDAVIVVKGGALYTLSKSTTLIAVSGVTDSGGIASFTHAGTTPAVGNTVTISGFVTNTAYNVTGIVTASTGTTFEISSVAYGTSETGSFTLVLADISGNANIVSCNSLTHMNGRFVYIPSDGSVAFFSDVGAAGTVQALSFFDAEQLPDNNTEVFQLNNILYIGGTKSIQSFLDRGLSPVPYLPQTGRIDVGIISGVVEIQDDDTGATAVFFIGKKKGQAAGIFAQVAGGATRISNEYIDTILETYTKAQLSLAIAGRYVWRGYDILYFTLPSDSFGFYQGNWHGLDTLISGENVPWQAGYIQMYELKYYSFYSENFSILDNVNKDSGDPFLRIIDGGIEQEGNFNFQSMNYHMSQGFNTTIGSMFLMLSDDNILYSPPVAANTGSLGNYSIEQDWNYPGGLGLYDRFMGYRLQTGEDINMSGTGLFVTPR